MPRVLLVEDNDLNRDMLSRRLARRGMAVECAIDGAAGVQLARESLPDVILMDIGLPVIDGWQAIAQLKALPETRDIPIVALTAHALAEDQDRALSSGCAGFVPKPIDMALLLAEIERVTSRRGAS